MESHSASNRFSKFRHDDKKLHKLFVYGTLKTGQPNHFHFEEVDHGDINFYGDATTIEEFPLVVATRWNLPFLLHAPGEGHIVQGEVYLVDDEMLEWIDDFEGHPEVYERMKVSVKVRPRPGLAGQDTVEEVECMSYFLKNFPQGLLQLHNYAAYDHRADEKRPYCVGDDFSDDDDVDEELEAECERIEAQQFYSRTTFEEECRKSFDPEFRGPSSIYQDLHREAMDR